MGCNCSQLPPGHVRAYDVIRPGKPVVRFQTRTAADAEVRAGGGTVRPVLVRA